MAPTRFMRVPFFVVGELVTEENMAEIAKWCEGHVIDGAKGRFVRVPVNRPTNKKQTEAYAGTWVILSVQRDEESFKVYTDEWLRSQFFQMPDGSALLDEEGFPNNVRKEAPTRVDGDPRSIPLQGRPTPARLASIARAS